MKMDILKLQSNKRSPWLEVLGKPWNASEQKTSQREYNIKIKRFPATSHRPGVRMQMTLLKLLHRKRRKRIQILHLHVDMHKRLFSMCAPCTIAYDSSCSYLAGYKLVFLQHSLNRSHISGQCVILKLWCAQFSSNKRNPGRIPAF